MSTPKKPRFISRGETTDESNDWTYNEWLCRPDIADADKLMMIRATMPPNCCHPFHTHPHREEIIHVVTGKAEQWVGEECRILLPGDVAIIPAGVVHATYNPSDQPLVFHAILSPGNLGEEEAAAIDPQDVSGEAPWNSIRGDRQPCTTLGALKADEAC